MQGFFLHLLEGDEFLLRLDPARGRFRGYLKAGLDHFLANQYASAAALKRGGGVRVVPLDTALAERELLAAPEDPTAAYDREWALRVMEQAVAGLRAEYAEGRRQGDADLMLRFFGLGQAPTYAEAAAASGLSVPQLKASLHRARVRFRALLRAEISETMGPNADLDQEMVELMRALGA